MTNRSLMISMTLLSASVCPAYAAAELFKATFAVTEYDRQIDAQAEPARYSYLLAGTATANWKRPFSVSGEVEFGEALPGALHCPEEQPVEYPVLAGGVIALTDSVTQDVLYLTTGEGGYECFSSQPSPAPASAHLSGNFTGGLGKFRNATGHFNADSAGYVLRKDAAGHVFASGKGTLSGLLNLGGK